MDRFLDEFSASSVLPFAVAFAGTGTTTTISFCSYFIVADVWEVISSNSESTLVENKPMSANVSFWALMLSADVNISKPERAFIRTFV